MNERQHMRLSTGAESAFEHVIADADDTERNLALSAEWAQLGTDVDDDGAWLIVFMVLLALLIAGAAAIGPTA